MSPVRIPGPKPEHYVQLLANLDEVCDLVSIHVALTGAGPGRRGKVKVLNKSGIVLLVACWEAFVEDLATAAFDFLLAKAPGPRVFPSRVLVSAGKSLRESSDDRAIWALAESGWRK